MAMHDISGYGLRVVIKATRTYPQGVELTQFADDADPLDIPSVQFADKAMTMNGELLIWAKANPIIVTLNMVPGSTDDQTLAALVEANRPRQGAPGARDEITMSVYYPSGEIRTIAPGAITDGMLGLSPSSAGRYKSKSYAFAFADTAASRAP